MDFLVRGCGQKIASPAFLGQITEMFETPLRAWADQHKLPGSNSGRVNARIPSSSGTANTVARAPTWS